jgi:hypothetical protein
MERRFKRVVALASCKIKVGLGRPLYRLMVNFSGIKEFLRAIDK